MDSSEAVEVDVCMYVCFFFPVWANKHDHRRQEHPCWRMASSLRADGDGGTTAGVVLPLTLVGSGIYDAYVMSCPRNLTRLRLSLHFCSAYTVPVSIGDQSFSLQVDTGSSDLVSLTLQTV